MHLSSGGLLPCLCARRCDLHFCSGSRLARLLTWRCGLRFLGKRRPVRLLTWPRCVLLARSLRLRALRLIRKGDRHWPQQRRRAHPKREKEQFSHVSSLDDCFGLRAVPAADSLLPLSTATKLLVSQRLSLIFASGAAGGRGLSIPWSRPSHHRQSHRVFFGSISGTLLETFPGKPAAMPLVWLSYDAPPFREKPGRQLSSLQVLRPSSGLA